MRKIILSEYQVLEQLVYIESFDTVKSDTGLQFGELRDDLINLYNSGYVEIYSENQTSLPERINYFDSDRPQLFSYRATKAGLDAMKKFTP